MLRKVKQLAARALWVFLSVSMWPSMLSLQHGSFRVAQLLTCLLRAPNVMLTPGGNHITFYRLSSDVMQCPTPCPNNQGHYKGPLGSRQVNLDLTSHGKRVIVTL